MDVGGAVKEKLSRLEELHSTFERDFPGVYEEKDPEVLMERIRALYALSGQKLELASALYREVGGGIGGGRVEEGGAKELYRNEHQMKFRLEEILSILTRGQDYDTRTKLSTAIDRVAQFHRIYDYAVRKALAEMRGGEVEGGLSLLFEGEKEKKVPTGIMEELGKVKRLEVELETLKAFLFRLYAHPGDVHKVEDALRNWHSRGLLWVEARNVEKLSGVENAGGEILEGGLALMGVVEKR